MSGDRKCIYSDERIVVFSLGSCLTNDADNIPEKDQKIRSGSVAYQGKSVDATDSIEQALR